jgi:cell division protein ZapE
MIKDAYEIILRDRQLVHDVAQVRVVDALQKLQLRVCANEKPGRRLSRRLRIRRTGSDFSGLFLWGSVGRGKTFLMDLFFDSLDIQQKRRIHFHRMMSEVHSRLGDLGNEEDPLEIVAEIIAAETRVLCFDEFFVSDIGDAMILGRLIGGLFRRNVVLVTTSNTPPSGLYPNGLQRERFLPAIKLLEQHTEVLHMDGDDDYRLRLMEAAGTYLFPADAAADTRLRQFFDDIAAGRQQQQGNTEILGRPVPAERCAKGIAWFEFEQICGGPRSQQDYIEIARWYQTVIVSGVPLLTSQMDDSARRFIALVDEFYDRRVKLIVSAMAEVGQLYQGNRLQFEFRRTSSRLTEMQSREYLHSAHIS